MLVGLFGSLGAGSGGVGNEWILTACRLHDEAGQSDSDLGQPCKAFGNS